MIIIKIIFGIFSIAFMHKGEDSCACREYHSSAWIQKITRQYDFWHYLLCGYNYQMFLLCLELPMKQLRRFLSLALCLRALLLLRRSWMTDRFFLNAPLSLLLKQTGCWLYRFHHQGSWSRRGRFRHSLRSLWILRPNLLCQY